MKTLVCGWERGLACMLLMLGVIHGCSQGAAAISDSRGARIASACYACHGGVDRSGNPRIPELRGRPADYLEQAMEAYADGRRPNKLMKRFVAGLSASQRAAVASFYSKIQP